MNNNNSSYNANFLILTILILLISDTAWANIEAPFWRPWFVLRFETVLSTILEGLIISFVFKTGKMRCLGIMFLANIFTVILGRLALELGVIPITRMDMTQPLGSFEWSWHYAILTLLLNYILELPFVFWASKKTKNNIRKVLIVGFIIQLLSSSLFSPVSWLIPLSKIQVEYGLYYH